MKAISMRKVAGYAAFTLAAGYSICYGQDRWDALTARTSKLRGLHLYGVSVYYGYSTFSGPLANLEQLVPVNLNIGSDMNYGTQWGLGWHHEAAKTMASISYTGNYGGRKRYTNLNSFGHSLGMNVNRQLHTKWSLNLSMTGDYRTLAQYLFQPTAQSVISQVPGSASDLGAAFSAGNFSNNDAAATFSASGLDPASSPARDLLLADRILTYQLQAAMSYAHSTRLRFNFAAASAGGQQSFDNNSTVVMPRTLGANAGVSMSYSLSPRTNIGLNVSENHTRNQFQDAYSTDASGLFGRMMGERWFLSITGGLSYTRMPDRGSGSFPSRQMIGGASIGYRARAHTFLGGYHRSSSDAYGIAVGNNTNMSGSWYWRRPGSTWSTFATVGQHQIRNAGFTSLTGWRTNVGFVKTLSSQFSLTAEYSYLYTIGSYLSFANQRTIHSIRLSLRWHPQGTPRLEQAPTAIGAGGDFR